MSRGIDYGMGTTNVDRENGIRYGVIPAHDVGQAWYDESESNYGDPHCPKCGNAARELSEIETDADEWERAKYECEEYACESCKYVFGGESAYGDTPISHDFSSDGYECTQGGDDTDIFIIKSPYYTRAQFCSPCAPGACYLENPCDDGERTYCFGHDWFENGIAPYPVYRVSDDTLVQPDTKLRFEQTTNNQWMILVDGVQFGGNRDMSGAGCMTFDTLQLAIAYACENLY